MSSVSPSDFLGKQDGTTFFVLLLFFCEHEPVLRGLVCNVLIQESELIKNSNV